MNTLRKSLAAAGIDLALADRLEELEADISGLEKRFAAENAARYHLASADSDRARIVQLESELAALRARHDGDTGGVSKTLGRGALPSHSEDAQGHSTARQRDQWRN